MVSRDDSEIELIRCKKCGHLWQPIENYMDIYSEGEFSNIARNGNAPSSEKMKQLDNMAFSRFNFYKTYLDKMDNILEVGSYVGSFVNLLKIYGKNVTGLEPDPDYSAYSEKQYGFKQITSLLENFEAKNKYDGIISFHVIEHVKNPHIFLKSVFDLLDNNGKVLFECPSLDIHLNGDINKFIWKPHIHYFSLTSIYYLFSLYFNVLALDIKQDSLYIYAEKNNNKPNFNTLTFTKLKIASRCMYSLNNSKLVPLFGKKITLALLREPYQSLKQAKSITIKKINYFLYVKNEMKNKNKIPVSHISVYTLGNVGDTVLSKCVRDTFNKICSNKLKWNLYSVWSPVDQNLIENINKSEFLLIGGGGLLLPDTNKNSISGWQWACSKENLKNINKKIIVFAIGYNYFKGQEPEELFIDNLRELVTRASFFGVRNNGSCGKVRAIVGKNLENKIVFQPCPTTLIRKLYELPDKNKTRNIAFNIAFDRYERRFGRNMYSVLDQIALAAKKLSNKGYKIYNVAHVDNDLIFGLSLQKHAVPYKTILLGGEFPDKVFDFYNKMDVVIGMRGHAQMIPFGLNCGIITLGSHEKMRWFLEDIDFLDLYIDLDSNIEIICQEIIKRFELFYSEENYYETIQKIKAKQEYLYKITLEIGRAHV